MDTEIEDQQPVEAIAEVSADAGVAVVGGGEGEQGREQEAGGGEECRATEPKARATEEPEAVGAVVEQLDSSVAVEGSVVTGRSSEEAGGSGARGENVELIVPRQGTRRRVKGLSKRPRRFRLRSERRMYCFGQRRDRRVMCQSRNTTSPST